MGDNVKIESPEYHYHYGSDTTSSTNTSNSGNALQARKGLGTLAKLAIAGGLVASGAGIGAVVPVVMDFIQDIRKPAPTPVDGGGKTGAVDTDTNNWETIRLRPPTE